MHKIVFDQNILLVFQEYVFWITTYVSLNISHNFHKKCKSSLEKLEKCEIGCILLITKEKTSENVFLSKSFSFFQKINQVTALVLQESSFNLQKNRLKILWTLIKKPSVFWGFS